MPRGRRPDGAAQGARSCDRAPSCRLLTSRRRVVLGYVGWIVDEAFRALIGPSVSSTVVGTAIGTSVLLARRALGTTVGRSFGALIGAAVGTTVLLARRALGTTVGRSFRCG